MPEHPDTLIWVAGVKPALGKIRVVFERLDIKDLPLLFYPVYIGRSGMLAGQIRKSSLPDERFQQNAADG